MNGVGHYNIAFTDYSTLANVALQESAVQVLLQDNIAAFANDRNGATYIQFISGDLAFQKELITRLLMKAVNSGLTTHNGNQKS